LVYSILLSIGKNVLKMTETLWKNSLIIAKRMGIIYVNFIFIAVMFLREKIGGITLYCSSYNVSKILFMNQ
jgi:hypothetical protein